MSSTNNAIKYGDKDVLPDQEFDPRDAKVRISIMIDGDILDRYKKEAERLHTKYQTLMNQKLRESLSEGESSPNSVTLKNISDRMDRLEKRFYRERAGRIHSFSKIERSTKSGKSMVRHKK